MTFLDCLHSPKFDFMQHRSGGKIIKYQQSQALTSHFETFWSIVLWFFQFQLTMQEMLFFDYAQKNS